MTKNRLTVVAVESSNPQTSSVTPTKRRREEAKAKFEYLWKTDPQQFNPLRDAMERERISRTWELILSHIKPEGKTAVDLGCGKAILTERLCEHGAHVHAVDIANIPLNLLEEKVLPNLTTSQDYVPRTILNDNTYDIVLGTEMIAYLPTDEYRLFFSEMARIIKKDGSVVCSTPLDINSEDALQRFATLAETEFQVDDWSLSYHASYIRFYDFLKAPSIFAAASRDPRYRAVELQKRLSISHWWFKMNSASFPGAIWSLAEYVFNPIARYVGQSHWILNKMEKVCKFMSSESGISHATFIGKRRPMATMPPANEIPIERKQKRQVWE